MRINLYAQQRHVLIIDGIPISGFAEGDWFEFEPDGNAATRTLGGDGPAMNLSVGQGAKASISLMPVSPQLGDLYALREAQEFDPRLFSIVFMSGVEEVLSLSGCAFGKLPSFQSGGPTMQSRKFDFEILEYKMDTSAIESVAGGFLGSLF